VLNREACLKVKRNDYFFCCVALHLTQPTSFIDGVHINVIPHPTFRYLLSFSFSFACAAESLAIGTLKGEQLT